MNETEKIEYDLVNWQDGLITKEATVNIEGQEYTVTPRIINGRTPLNSNNLTHMDNGIKQVTDKVNEILETGGGISVPPEVYIQDEEPTEDTAKIWIDNKEIPTIGSEIESGTGENGTWVKFADGTMIITQYYSLSNLPITNQWGSLYISDAIVLKDYPKYFVGPVPNLSFYLTGGQSCLVMNNNFSTIHNPGNVQLVRGTSLTMTEGYLSVTAIGRWK